MSERHIDRLIARSRAGDPRAFGKLYDIFADRVYAYARSRVLTVQDAEDVTETVFMKAWEAIASYDNRGLPFSAWLFRIARNVVVDGYRRESRTVPTVEITAAETTPDRTRVDEQVIARLGAETVQVAIGKLTEEQAAVVTMRFIWDMSLKDVADALGKTEGAIKALQHRAMRALAALLIEGRDDDDS